VTAGEGMPQDRRRKAGCLIGERARILRAVAGASLLAVLVGLSTPAARADDDGSQSAFSKFMRGIGLTKATDANSNINYTERAPLVVPPSRDLPPPADSATVPAPDWPKDPAKPAKNDKAKAGVVPGTAVQTPNPPFQKKPWYNPAGWFDKEEYANFEGEPVRKYLSDPPAGYRVPSPAQPYGIPSEKDKAKSHATASDYGMTAATPPK
jgi:hypothetical protein